MVTWLTYTVFAPREKKKTKIFEAEEYNPCEEEANRSHSSERSLGRTYSGVSSAYERKFILKM